MTRTCRGRHKSRSSDEMLFHITQRKGSRQRRRVDHCSGPVVSIHYPGRVGEVARTLAQRTVCCPWGGAKSRGGRRMLVGSRGRGRYHFPRYCCFVNRVRDVRIEALRPATTALETCERVHQGLISDLSCRGRTSL